MGMHQKISMSPIAFGVIFGALVFPAGSQPRAENSDGTPNHIVDASTDLILERLAVSLSSGSAVSTALSLSVESSGSNIATVPPGTRINYQVTGVLSDDANEGLALFGFDLNFNGGDLSHADIPTGVPTPGCDNPMINFTLPWGITNPDSPCPPACGFGGTIINGDLIQAGGGQNTINNTPDNAPFPIGPVLTGVAMPSGCGSVVLVSGTVVAPIVPGTYTLFLDNPFANIIRQGATGEPFWEVEAASIGEVRNLTIEVDATPTEACCNVLAGTCEDATPDECFALGGEPQGSGSQCEQPVGCCLSDGSCTVVAPVCCDDHQSLDNPGPPRNCGIVGPQPCCFSDGTCQVMWEFCCTEFGGTRPSDVFSCAGDADSDGLDGVCGDTCPEDPLKTLPGECGCGVPDTDSDKDGIADCLESDVIPSLSGWGLVTLALLLVTAAKKHFRVQKSVGSRSGAVG